MNQREFRQQELIRQKSEYPFFIPLNTVTVAASNVNTTQTITIGSDGDFRISHITGAIEPNGNSLNTISVQITDQGAGRNLTEGYIPANLFLSPGINTNQLFFPWKFNYTVKATATLKFDFLNSDATARTIDILLYGTKILNFK